MEQPAEGAHILESELIGDKSNPPIGEFGRGNLLIGPAQPHLANIFGDAAGWLEQPIERGPRQAKLGGDRIRAQVRRREFAIDVAPNGHERGQRRRDHAVAGSRERRRDRFGRQGDQTLGDRVEIGQPHPWRRPGEGPHGRAYDRPGGRLGLENQTVQRIFIRDERQNPIAHGPQRHPVHQPIRRRLAHRQRLRQVDEQDVAGIGVHRAIAREPRGRAIDLEADRNPPLGRARRPPNERKGRIAACAQHVTRRGVDIDLAPESRNLRRSCADFEHLAQRAAPLDEQFRWGAIFGLEAQSTQTGRRRTPHPFILRPFQPRRKRSMTPPKGSRPPCASAAASHRMRFCD